MTADIYRTTPGELLSNNIRYSDVVSNGLYDGVYDEGDYAASGS